MDIPFKEDAKIILYLSKDFPIKNTFLKTHVVECEVSLNFKTTVGIKKKIEGTEKDYNVMIINKNYICGVEPINETKV